jgi:hypothetical protein
MRTPRGYVIRQHVLDQAALKGYTVEQVVRVIDDPTIRYENRRYPGQFRHIRDGLVVCVDPTRQVAITLYADRIETPQRPDQTDADARRHFNGK